MAPISTAQEENNVPPCLGRQYQTGKREGQDKVWAFMKFSGGFIGC